MVSAFGGLCFLSVLFETLGLDADRLYVAESFCMRGSYRKGIRYHGRGHAGEARHPSTHYFVILKEWPQHLEKPPLIGRRGWKQRYLFSKIRFV